MTGHLRKYWLRRALILGLITVGYNILEGLVSVFFGTSDDALALAGFGLDSFVEVVSGAGVVHLVWRLRRDPAARPGRFERQALRITGFSFFLLTAGLLAGTGINLCGGSRPETTVPGAIIATVSLLTMWALYLGKARAGRALDSAPLMADAACTVTCLYLSIILLVSSLLYHFFQIPFLDEAGALGIAWFAFREGREAFAKARSNDLTCGCGSGRCHSNN